MTDALLNLRKALVGGHEDSIYMAYRSVMQVAAREPDRGCRSLLEAVGALFAAAYEEAAKESAA